MGDELLIFLFCLGAVFFLSVEFLLHELKELVCWYILELPIVVINEPLKYFFKCILSSLLIGNIETKSWLFVERGERICSLLKTCFQAIKMSVITIWWVWLILIRLSTPLLTWEHLGIILILLMHVILESIFHIFWDY